MYFKSLVLVGLMATPAAINAKIIDHGTYLTDTRTKLDWLDFNVTQNQSFNTVSGRINGGDLVGWTYATGDQFDGLVSSFGGTPMTCSSGQDYCGWSTSNQNVAVRMMYGYLGVIDDDYQRSGGILADEGPRSDSVALDDPRTKWVAYLADSEGFNESETQDFIDTHLFAVPYDEGRFDTASFLVRVSEVPIPAAGWLFISAIAGLAGLKHKARRQ